MLRLLAILARNRAIPGNLWMATDKAPCMQNTRCLAQADGMYAIQQQNPTSSPMFHGGGLPLGVFRVVKLPPMPGTPENLHAYGPGPVFSLRAVSGPCLEAETKNGRTGLLIHGGPLRPDPAGSKGFLRATHGCLRVDDESIMILAGYYDEPFQMVVVEI